MATKERRPMDHLRPVRESSVNKGMWTPALWPISVNGRFGHGRNVARLWAREYDGQISRIVGLGLLRPLKGAGEGDFDDRCAHDRRHLIRPVRWPPGRSCRQAGPFITPFAAVRPGAGASAVSPYAETRASRPRSQRTRREPPRRATFLCAPLSGPPQRPRSGRRCTQGTVWCGFPRWREYQGSAFGPPRGFAAP